MKPKTYRELEILENGVTCRARIPTTRWSDDAGRWVNVDAGDAGTIASCRKPEKIVGAVYLVLMFRQRATIYVNHSSIHRHEEWEILT